MAKYPTEALVEVTIGAGGQVKRVRQCQAKVHHEDRRCMRPARRGRDTCSKHAGGRKPTTGKYSKYLTTPLKTKVEQYEKDPDLKSLRSEIAMLRSAMADMLSKKPAGSFSRDELAVVVKMCESIAKIAKTEDEITVGKRYVLTIEDTEKVISQVIWAIKSVVDDQLLLGKIQTKLEEIRVR